MTDINPLIIYPHRLSETPVTIGGDLPMQVLDLAEDDRTAYPNPFSYQLDLTLVNDSVLVRGTLVTVLRRRCDRCLVYYDQPVQIDDVCYFFKNSDADAIDLTDPIREDILLGFPQRSVCRDDCEGLCGRCGQNLNSRDCGCRPEAEPEALWQALDKVVIPEDES